MQNTANMTAQETEDHLNGIARVIERRKLRVALIQLSGYTALQAIEAGNAEWAGSCAADAARLLNEMDTDRYFLDATVIGLMA